MSRYAPYGAYPYIEPNVRFSRIRLPTKLIIHSCPINTDIYLRSCQWIDLQHIIECLPCVAYFLATPIEPIKETSLNSIPKAVYGSEIVSYNVIVIVPNKYLIQLCFPFNPEIPRLAVQQYRYDGKLLGLKDLVRHMQIDPNHNILGSVVVHTKKYGIAVKLILKEYTARYKS